MDRTRRRALAYAGLIAGVTVFYTLAYKFGMQVLEGETRSILESFQIVVQTFTTTGYGEDAPWQSTQMLVLVILMQLTGVFFIFLTLPLFVVPWVEQRLELQARTSYDGEGHVVICGFSERGDALITELDAQGVPYVVIVDERARWRELHESGYSAILGNAESTDTLRDVHVTDAMAVVLDQGKEANATIALSVRELTTSVRMVAFVDDADFERYLTLAGVDEVLLPRDLLGRNLADKVTSVIKTQLGETVDIGADVEIIELPIQKGSRLDGVSLDESGFREETGANIIGTWIDGSFVANPGPETEFDRNMVLLVSGERSQLKSAMELTAPPGRSATREVIIAGYGKVGKRVRDSLQAAHIQCTVIDKVEMEGVDVVGDASNEEVLQAAGIEDAGAFIVSLADDTDAVFATLVAREANQAVEIIARVNETGSASKLYAAGADYVLALSRVSGRMLAESILGEDVIAYETQIEIVRTDAPSFEGETIGNADIRARTGCTVIAVERDGEIQTDLGPGFVIEPGDNLIVAGADENIARFHEVAEVRSTPDR